MSETPTSPVTPEQPSAPAAASTPEPVLTTPEAQTEPITTPEPSVSPTAPEPAVEAVENSEHESFIQKVEEDFDALIAKAKGFLEHLIEHKQKTVEKIRSAPPVPETTAAPAVTSGLGNSTQAK